MTPPEPDGDTVSNMDLNTFMFLAVVVCFLFIVAVVLCVVCGSRACGKTLQDEMDNSPKQTNLKKRLLNQLKKEAKEMSKTQRRTNILRTISTRAENKENKLPDIENPAPVAESAADCSICLEKFYGDAVKINIGVLTSCGHYFHFECLWEWLRMQLSCPICRNKIRWSERDIRAVTYARILEDTSQQAGISFVPRGEEDTHSVTSVESLEYSGCFPRLTNRVLPAVHQTRTEQQDHQRQHRIQRILSVQETLSNVALAQVYFI